MTCYIAGSGASLPERRVTNAELAPRLGVAPAWITANCGIEERRWVAPDQSASDLAATAVQDALESAGLPAKEVDYLIGATISPDYQVPGIAPLVQRKLDGLGQVAALDIRAGCASILYALDLARALVESGSCKNVVCFGAEAQSKGLALSPRSAEMDMLFGDGAGALVVSSQPPDNRRRSPAPFLRIVDILVGTDGRFAEDLCVRSPGTANGPAWLDEASIGGGLHYGLMSGRTVILQAVRKLGEAARAILDRNNMKLEDIDLIVPHQANANLLRTTCKQLSVPEEKLVINLDRFGNTSSASAFLALWQADREGRWKEGRWVLFLAFGAGFTWGAALCQACAA